MSDPIDTSWMKHYCPRCAQSFPMSEAQDHLCPLRSRMLYAAPLMMGCLLGIALFVAGLALLYA